MSQRVPPRMNPPVNQSVLTGCRTIITRVFAYGKSQVKVSSQTETQQAGCKVAQREPIMQDAYFSCVRVLYRIHDLHGEM